MGSIRGESLNRESVVPLAFAAAVTMWMVAYVGRLPAVTAPSWSLAVVMLAAVVGWAWWAGRRASLTWIEGAAAGALAAVINLLILGSLLAHPDGGLRPSAAVWVVGSVLMLSVVSAVSVSVGRGPTEPGREQPDWTALFSKVAVGAAFLLVVAGGLVTSHEAGLAVVDWPNTFGTNMFLYPLARMTGGIYYEHAHRLFGALVGLTTVALALRLWRCEARAWVRRAAAVAVIVVVIQGILGGLRVTGNFTLSTSTEDMAPNIVLAVMHGVLGQLFLALLVILAAATSRWWKTGPEPERRAGNAADRALQAWLVAVLFVQLIFGAVQRHVAQGLIVHITLAAVVAMVAVAAGARAWGLYHGSWPVQRLGQAVLAVMSIQVTLGIAALAVTQGRAVVGHPTVFEVSIATAHQATGALLLALSVLLAAWTRRLFIPED
jgi:cytochrome c oxidase assembly protein subunit 15